jgi:hypothetical protein
MEMINRCLEITAAKRDELEAFDRAAKRKEMIANRVDGRSEMFSNRKERRRQAALKREQEKVRL